MDYLKPADFKQLKAFFLALQQSRFNLKQISTVVTMDGVRTPVDKAHCLELLRSFPDLSGEEFKDDNSLIKYLSQPGNIKRILGRLTTAQQIELTKVLEEKPVTAEVTGEQPSGGETSAEQGVPPETPVGTATGTAGMPGLPSAPSISSGPRRIIYRVPRAPEPSKPELSIANSSGVVRETGDPSKLVTTDKSGRIVKGPGAETPPSKIYLADKSGNVVGEHTIKSPSGTSGPPVDDVPRQELARGIKGGGTVRLPYQATNAVKNFGSNAQIFARKNLGRIGRGLGEIAGGVGRGIAGPGLTGTYNLLGKAANGGLNAFERLSNPGLRGASRSFMSSGSKKMAWGLVGALIFIIIGAGLIGGLTGGGTSSQTGNVGIGTTAAPISPTGIQPRPAAPIIDPSGLRQAIIEKFGITMNGYDNDHLKWAWDKFWDVSNTNFISFVRGSVITTDSDSRQVGCPGEPTAVYLSQYPEGLFKYALTHELGHVIKNCLNSTANFVADFFNAFNKERGVTYYANNASICTGSDNQSEDYAETVALYLNPNANIQMTKCATDAGVTKYTNLKTDFPLHYNVARSILGDY